MRRSPKGYTIVEVLIVIAISGALLAAASLLLKGQQSETIFQQSLSDINSKIQNTVKGVSNSLFPNSSQYTCSLQAGTDGVKRATLKKEAGGGVGTNQDCLFLGKALQVIKGQGAINIYSVLGGRTYDTGNQSKLAVTFAQTNPEPAITGGTDLTENFRPSTNGAFLLSAKYDGSAAAEVDLAGFYNDLEGSSATDQQLLAKAYTHIASANDPKTGVANCVEEQASCAHFPLAHWLLCYQNSDKNRTALLDITATASGVTTQLKFITCN